MSTGKKNGSNVEDGTNLEEQDREYFEPRWEACFGDQMSKEEVEKTAESFQGDSVKNRFCNAIIMIKCVEDKSYILRAIDIFKDMTNDLYQTPTHENILEKSKGIQSRPYQKESMYYMSVGYYVIGDLMESKFWCEKLLKFDKDHTQGQQLLSIIDQAIGKYRSDRKKRNKKKGSHIGLKFFSSTSDHSNDASQLKKKMESNKKKVEDTHHSTRIDLMKEMKLVATELASGSRKTVSRFIPRTEKYAFQNFMEVFSHEEVEYLMKIFNNIDAMHAGFFDKEQFANACGILGRNYNSFIFQYLFRAFEVVNEKLLLNNKSNHPSSDAIARKDQISMKTIEMGIFLATSASLMKSSKREQLEIAFEMLDKEKKGHISKSNILEQLINIFEILEDFNLETVDPNYAANFIFGLLDVNNTSTVNKEQFITQCIAHHEKITGLGLINPPSKHAINSINPLQKRGNAAMFGSQNFNTTIDIMLGVRQSQDMFRTMNRRVRAEDFSVEVKFHVRRKKKKEDAESDASEGYILMTDYAPRVFQKLREIHGISESEYLMSIGPEQLLGNLLLCNLTSLSEIATDGRSGSYFYYTQDGKFIIKQIAPEEATAFRKTLSEYFQYITEHPNSFLCRYFGFFELNGTFFLIMKNIFTTREVIHETYDLKGSKIARSNPQGPVYKDNDLLQAISVGDAKRKIITNILYEDIKFLHELKFTDYSLLLGIHYKTTYPGRQSVVAQHQIKQKNKKDQPKSTPKTPQTNSRPIVIHHQNPVLEVESPVITISSTSGDSTSTATPPPPPPPVSPQSSPTVTKTATSKTTTTSVVTNSTNNATTVSQSNSSISTPSTNNQKISGGMEGGEAKEATIKTEETTQKVSHDNPNQNKENVSLTAKSEMSGLRRNGSRSLSYLLHRDQRRKVNNLEIFQNDGGIESEDHKQVYYLGIIDMLTTFNMKKFAEHKLKSIKYPTRKNEISAQPPDEYAQRLKHYISQIIE